MRENTAKKKMAKELETARKKPEPQPKNESCLRMNSIKVQKQ